eukprot:5487926-Pleurochrysis_carterae.AAC.2
MRVEGYSGTSLLVDVDKVSTYPLAPREPPLVLLLHEGAQRREHGHGHGDGGGVGGVRRGGLDSDQVAALGRDVEYVRGARAEREGAHRVV